MSALSLMYPRKPWEVADDVESLIYILLYMALRFHHHSMTRPRQYPIGLSAEDIQKKNATNRMLASRVFTLFWEEEDCEGDYVSGGSMKHLWISNGNPPVRLTDTKSPLAQLLKRLYELLQEHYQAVNYADLERFKCKVLGSDGGSVGAVPPADVTGRSVATRATVPMDPIAQFPNANKARDRYRTTPSHAVAPVASSSTSVAPALPVPAEGESVLLLVKKSKRVMDDHTMLFDALDSVLYENGTAKDLANVNDKWFDQFDGLRTYVGADDKKSSGSGSKRKREDSELEQVLFEMLKKRVRGDFGWRVAMSRKLDTIPEGGIGDDDDDDEVEGDEEWEDEGEGDEEGEEEDCEEKHEEGDGEQTDISEMDGEDAELREELEEVAVEIEKPEPPTRRSKRIADRAR